MGFFIIIAIILLLPVIIPFIGRKIKEYAMGKMEDRMRRMMGMPTRSEEKKARKAQAKTEARRDGWTASSEEGERGSSRFGFRSRHRNHNVGNPAEDIRMMRMYAEDVEFVEIREYSAELRFEQDEQPGKVKFTYEEQVSDAEFVVIK